MKILILRSLSALVTSGRLVFFRYYILVYFMWIQRNLSIGYRPNKVARFLCRVDLALDTSFACIVLTFCVKTLFNNSISHIILYIVSYHGIRLLVTDETAHDAQYSIVAVGHFGWYTNILFYSRCKNFVLSDVQTYNNTMSLSLWPMYWNCIRRCRWYS